MQSNNRTHDLRPAPLLCAQPQLKLEVHRLRPFRCRANGSVGFRFVVIVVKRGSRPEDEGVWRVPAHGDTTRYKRFAVGGELAQWILTNQVLA
jgi:hypothetical protein